MILKLQFRLWLGYFSFHNFVEIHNNSKISLIKVYLERRFKRSNIWLLIFAFNLRNLFGIYSIYYYRVFFLVPCGVRKKLSRAWLICSYLYSGMWCTLKWYTLLLSNITSYTVNPWIYLEIWLILLFLVSDWGKSRKALYTYSRKKPFLIE